MSSLSLTSSQCNQSSFVCLLFFYATAILFQLYHVWDEEKAHVYTFTDSCCKETNVHIDPDTEWFILVFVTLQVGAHTPVPAAVPRQWSRWLYTHIPISYNVIFNLGHHHKWLSVICLFIGLFHSNQRLNTF